MIVPLLIGAGVLVAGLFGYAASRPNEFKIQRKARVKATPEKVFPHINDFHRWEAWSPWEKLDPAMTRKHSGPANGKGAAYEWQGNKKVGKGRMEITEATAPRRVVIDLHFMEPWQARNTTEFLLEPAGGETDVTWTMTGTNPFMMKVMGIFMNMDKAIGSDFEKGLTSLKTATEG
jgi:uncharacterized protein YndB with AHSA1/START domain